MEWISSRRTVLRKSAGLQVPQRSSPSASTLIATMEGIKALLNPHLDNHSRAEHRRLLHELAEEIANDWNIWMNSTKMNGRNQGRPHQKTLIVEDPHTKTHLLSKNTTQLSSPPPRQAPPKRSRRDLKDETESPPTKKTRLNTENGKSHLRYITNGRIS